MRRRRNDEPGLDSLLDTMTNLVGILVVLVAVTQMSVATSMGRIQQAEDERRTATQVQRSTSPALAADFADQEASARAELARLEAWRNAIEDRSLGAPSEARSRAARRRENQLEKRIARARNGLRDLRVHLEGLDAASLAATEVRLPDPRPPPADGLPVRVFARYERVAVLPERDLLKLITRESSAIAGVDYFNDVDNFPISRLVSRFSRHDLGSRDFVLKLSTASQGRLGFEILWRGQDRGESLREIAQLESRFRATLDELDPKRHYLEFKVWPDGFEAYLLARRIAEARGFHSGWKEFDEEGRYRGIIDHQTYEPTPID